MFGLFCFCYYVYRDHRDRPVLTHDSPTRRSSTLPGAPGHTSGRGYPLWTNRSRPIRGDAPIAARRSIVLLMAAACAIAPARGSAAVDADQRSEEHTSELQSLMRISYAVFCLKKKNNTKHT